jgi:hypothetical protein
MYAIHYRQPGITTIADLLDVVSGLCESAAAARPLRFAAAGIQAISARRMERDLLRGVVPVTINDADRGRLADVGVNAFTVPLAVSLPPDRREAAGADGPGSLEGVRLRAPLGLLFVGSFLHSPNHEAARFLVRRLAPALRAAGVAFELTLAGRAAPAWLFEESGADLHVFSDVEDLAPLYREADVVLAPLAHGGGTKNKTLEAMAWGLPVLGTPQAFTGLGALDDEAYVCTALDAGDMVSALIRLARDPALRVRLGEAGRTYVGGEHTEALAEGRALALFDAVAEGGGVSAAEALWRRRRAAVATQVPGAGLSTRGAGAAQPGQRVNDATAS